MQNNFIQLCCTNYKIPKNVAEMHAWKKVWTTSEEEKYLVQLVCLVDFFGGLWIGGPVMNETVRVLTTELSALTVNL